ncbi:matrixin family metalloprotease [Halorarius halobius]|uniref:matrixin family metalloprotease n=1 Tax=Halorarius halobius TaxID=2962671 RepID=UPI0020CEE55A|nr:matrixin family metalloprotease [Halorarius halobius]
MRGSIPSLWLVVVVATGLVGGGAATAQAPAGALTDGPVYLGTAAGENGPVEGYAFVLTEDELRQVDEDEAADDDCYELFAAGVRWRTVEPYRFDATNDEGLDATVLASNFAGAIARWERAAGTDILGGPLAPGDDVTVDRDGPDGRNEVVFGSVAAQDAVAVTVIWGEFSGPEERREITEWDMAFDADDYDWSLTGAEGTLDFDSVATHELGHAMGLAHPDPDCTEETMYQFTEPGTTSARSLEDGDRTGIRALYVTDDGEEDDDAGP